MGRGITGTLYVVDVGAMRKVLLFNEPPAKRILAKKKPKAAAINITLAPDNEPEIWYKA
jgi:hypothetical protein